MEGYKGYLTDAGVWVGHAWDEAARTGCTAVLAPGEGAVVGCDVRGGAPGTRETDLARPGQFVERANAVVLAGGSAYGLAAASGVMNYLESKGIGLNTGFARVPIVCGAVIYDLGVGSAKIRPDEAMGRMAAEAATLAECRQGLVGAGCGATVGKLLGAEGSEPGGLGSATVWLGGQVAVSALMVVNALGDIVQENGRVLAGLQREGRHLGTVETMLAGISAGGLLGRNTTIGVVATNAKLGKEGACRLAMSAHDGMAMAIHPVHTMADGDTTFALATGQSGREMDLTVLCAAAAEAVRRAVVNAAIASNNL